MSLKNERFLQALLREPVDATPVWIMRQAGRYLPEYRATRARAGDFLTLCKTPELACEVSLQPVRRFALDAAIIFSDILTVPDAMGLELSFIEGEGPRFRRTVRTDSDVDSLRQPDPEQELRYVMDAIRITARELDGSVPLIGFAGSPWTLATYMVEGGPSREFSSIKAMLYQAPATLHRLLGRLRDVVTAYLNAQIASGAQAIMLFDTWGGVLTRPAYLEFSLRYMAEILSGLTAESDGRKVPAIVFTKGGGQWLDDISTCGCHAVGLDWTTDIGEARQRVGMRVALQGNMDPAILEADPHVIRSETARILESFGRASGHVFNLGHGIAPHIDPERVAVLVDAVHDLSRKYHSPQAR